MLLILARAGVESGMEAIPGPGPAAPFAAGVRAATPKVQLSSLVDAAADADVDFLPRTRPAAAGRHASTMSPRQSSYLQCATSWTQGTPVCVCLHLWATWPTPPEAVDVH
eukprot:7254823-Lingulodinium_polyedra.AAC.1